VSVQVRDGDIFADPAEVWVNAVNCVGVMNAGIAKQFRQRFPDYFADYYTKCYHGKLELGRVDYYAVAPTRVAAPPPLFIVSFPTMLNPGEVARGDDLKAGMKSLKDFCDAYKIDYLAIPALGCGIGQFDFANLEDIVLHTFENEMIPEVTLYRPFDARAAAV